MAGLPHPPVLTRPTGDQLYAQGPGFFNVRTFGAVGDGVTDDRAAIQAAFNAAVAHANSPLKQAVVFFPAGLYLIKSGNIDWKGENTGRVIVRGEPAGIKFGSDYTQFIVATWNSPEGDFGRLTIEDLVFDNNNTKKNWGLTGIILNIDMAPANFRKISHITVQRCEVRNAPRPATPNDPFVICVTIDIYTFTYPDRMKEVSITDITIQDCLFGKVGYGGSFGVQLQQILAGNAVLQAPPKTANQIRNTEWEAGVFMDRIALRRIWHDGGPPSQTYFSNSNFIIGGSAHGGRLICEDLFGNTSGDDGLEVNAFLDVHINRVQFANSQTSYAILLTNGGGMPKPELQVVNITDSHFGPTAGNNGSSSIAIRYGQLSPYGTVNIKNCSFAGGGVLMYGVAQRFSMRDTTYCPTLNWTNGGFIESYPFDIDNRAGLSQVIIENLTSHFANTFANPNNVSNSYVTLGAIRFSKLADAVLDVRGVQLINNVKLISGTMWGTGPTLSAIRMPTQLGAIPATFDTADLGRGFDSGQSSDVVTSGGALNPSGTATLTNELRAMIYSAGTSYLNAAVGPQTDVCVEAQFFPGTTVTGFKAGMVGKVLSADTYTEAYIYDNGTTSYLCLDRVVGGVRSSILASGATISSPPSNVSNRGVALGSRITTGTGFYVRYKQQGKSVRADFHSSSIGYSGTVTTTASGTLDAAGDVRYFVTPSLYSGFVWVPQSTNSKMDNYNYYIMNVISGAFEDISTASHDALPASHINISNAMTASFCRVVNGPVRIVNSSNARHNGNLLVQDVSSFGDMGANWRRIARRLANGAVSTLTAPGSGTTYTNQNATDEQVHWYGGTLTSPFVEMSVDGGVTWESIHGSSTNGQATLMPGDRIRWIYSSAPTIRRIPIS